MMQPKVIANDIDSALVSSSEDIEGLDRPTGVTTGRTWAGPPAKMQVSDPQHSLLFLMSSGFVTRKISLKSSVLRETHVSILYLTRIVLV